MLPSFFGITPRGREGEIDTIPSVSAGRDKSRNNPFLSGIGAHSCSRCMHVMTGRRREWPPTSGKEFGRTDRERDPRMSSFSTCDGFSGVTVVPNRYRARIAVAEANKLHLQKEVSKWSGWLHIADESNSR